MLLARPAPDRRRIAVEAQVLRRASSTSRSPTSPAAPEPSSSPPPATSPTGSSRPGPAEDPANAHRSDLYLRAIREVVANCLYGADINDMAVEMCKLSLWLVSLDRDLPFSFVDDKVFLGNSLLGLTSLDQLRKLHIDPTAGAGGRHVRHLRRRHRRHHPQGGRPARAPRHRGRRGRPARNSAPSAASSPNCTGHRRLRTIADGVIAAGLPLGGKPGKALDEAYENLRIAVKPAHPEPATTGPTHLARQHHRPRPHPDRPTDYERWQPLHWVLEVPDVIVERGGFDAIIGNPPFLGGRSSPVRWATTFATGSSTYSPTGQGQRRPGRLLLPARVRACFATRERSG